MSTLNNIFMLSMAVKDIAKSKQFYEVTMGFKVRADFGQGDHHWVTLDLPGEDTSITLTTAHENMVPGTLKLYVSAPEIEAAHKQLTTAGASDIADDLYGPGSGVKWFSINDPDSNQWLVVQSTTRKPGDKF